MVKVNQNKRSYYQCNVARTKKHSHKKICHHKKWYPAEPIDEAVWAEVIAIIKDPERRRAGIEAYRQKQAGRANPLQVELKNNEGSITTVENELSGLYAEFKDAAGKRHRALLNSEIERLEEQLEALEDRRDNLKQQLENMLNTRADVKKLDDILAAMAADLETISDDLTSKRAFLHRIGLTAIIGTDNEGRRYVKIDSKINDSIGILFTTTGYVAQLFIEL